MSLAAQIAIIAGVSFAAAALFFTGVAVVRRREPDDQVPADETAARTVRIAQINRPAQTLSENATPTCELPAPAPIEVDWLGLPVEPLAAPDAPTPAYEATKYAGLYDTHQWRAGELVELRSAEQRAKQAGLVTR